MSRLRPLIGFLFVTLIHLFVALQATAAYECQQCPKRDITVFGIAVPPVEQDGMLSYADWMPMHLVGGGILNALFNEDSSRECLNFVDAQWAASGRGTGGSYQHGMGDFPAPAGAVGNADYIITGQIAVPWLGDKYMMRITLQAAGSREVVATAGGEYDFSKGGADNGKAMARQLMPLMEKIRDFEKSKRNEVPAMAIDVDEGLTIEPVRHFIKPHETVKIKYRLQDCDGEPLRGRIFAPFATLGHLNVTQAPQTDDNGELELEFTAGDKSGTAQLRAEFQYVLPFGREDTGGGVGKLQIVDHALWASVKVHHERHSNVDLKENYGKKIIKKNSHGSRAFSVYMYFEPKPFNVGYAKERATPIPVRFNHRLAGILPGQFVHYASGSSYEAIKGHPGLEESTTISFSETAQAGPIELRQEEIDYVTYEIDPKTKVITRVYLPTLESKYTVIWSRKCEKIDYENKSRSDCSSTRSINKTISTQIPASEECEEIDAIGPTMVSGGCRSSFSDEFTRRTSNYEWEFHRE